MKILAPAKVNLSLKILGKRPDGFHELQTLMATTGIADDLEIVEDGANGAVDFSCSDAAIPGDGSNLVVKAVHAFRDKTDDRRGVRIRLGKRIPHGAGLGGGSSDAAATLKALDSLCGTRLSADELGGLAASLGSDVPFFLSGGLAMCRGRGEIVEPLAGPPPAWTVLLAKPAFGVSTPWAYRAFAEGKAPRGYAHDARELDGVTLINDLEPPVFSKYVALAEMKAWLLAQDGVSSALMSGSGSTLFAVLDREAEAAALSGRLTERYGDTLWTAVTRIGDDTKR